MYFKKVTTVSALPNVFFHMKRSKLRYLNTEKLRKNFGNTVYGNQRILNILCPFKAKREFSVRTSKKDWFGRQTSIDTDREPKSVLWPLIIAELPFVLRHDLNRNVFEYFQSKNLLFSIWAPPFFLSHRITVVVQPRHGEWSPSHIYIIYKLYIETYIKTLDFSFSSN